MKAVGLKKGDIFINLNTLELYTVWDTLTPYYKDPGGAAQVPSCFWRRNRVCGGKSN